MSFRKEKYFFSAGTFKNMHNFKISIERANLYLAFISFCGNKTFKKYFSGKEKRDSGSLRFS